MFRTIVFFSAIIIVAEFLYLFVISPIILMWGGNVPFKHWGTVFILTLVTMGIAAFSDDMSDFDN